MQEKQNERNMELSVRVFSLLVLNRKFSKPENSKHAIDDDSSFDSIVCAFETEQKPFNISTEWPKTFSAFLNARCVFVWFYFLEFSEIVLYIVLKNAFGVDDFH